MRAFAIQLNRKRLCVAGIDGNGVLSAIVNHISGRGRQDLFFTVGGLVSANEEHVSWKTHLRLRLGDEIAVKIIETDVADRPRNRYHTDSKQDELNSKAHVRAIAKKYGWKLVTSPRRSK